LLMTLVYRITWNKPVDVGKIISFTTNGYGCIWKWETFQQWLYKYCAYSSIQTSATLL
jgi:hypothetical protein